MVLPTATSKEHLDQERKYLQSTKTVSIPTPEISDPDKNQKTNNVICAIEPLPLTQQAYSDLTRRFPRRSSRSNEYLLLAYHYDLNAILLEPLKNRQAAEITKALNLLRSARLNQKLSAYAYLFSQFDFDKTPLAPPGTRVVVHDRPESRPSWGFHGTDGWYVGPAFPEKTTDALLRQAVQDIFDILQNPPKPLSYLEAGDDTKNALLKIATLFKRATKPPQVTLISLPASEPVTRSQSRRRRAPAIYPAPENNIPLPRVNRVQASRVDSIQPPRVNIPADITPALPNFPVTNTQHVATPKIPVSIINKYHQSMLPNTPPVLFHIPTPKTQCRPSPSALHAELLNTNRALHAFLLPTINHIYTVDGKKETLATLLQGPKKGNMDESSQ